MYSITKYKPIDLIFNLDENIYNIVMENIKKYSKKNIYEEGNYEGEHIKIKKWAYKLGKNIKIRINKNKRFCISATVKTDYKCSLLLIKIDVSICEFKEEKNIM